MSPELFEFVLNRKKVYLPPRQRIHIYFNRGAAADKFRYANFMGKTTSISSRMRFLARFSFRYSGTSLP